MFATLLGALPLPDLEPTATPGDLLAARIAAQVEAGLEPVTDGNGACDPTASVVEAWRHAASLTDRAVKAVLRGPWTASWLESGTDGAASRGHDVMERAERTRDMVDALAAAGCPLVEIEEAAVVGIGDDAPARRLFREAHLRLARDVTATHLSLSIPGGSAWEAGAATILDPPYASLAVDLIAGPENWRLVAQAPRERGIVVGVIEPGGRDDGPELPVWAAQYAASTKGRGPTRVGIGTAGGLGSLPWARAVEKLRALGEAARVAGLPPGDLGDALDPRAVNIRTAALGRAARRRPRP